MGIFLKPGEKADPGKTVIHLRDRVAVEMADDEDRAMFITDVHFLFHKAGLPVVMITEVFDVTAEDVRNALGCDPPKWKEGKLLDPE